jgi:hypothetical protein
MLTNPAGGVAPEVLVELQAIGQAIEELMNQWQACVQQQQCPQEKSTEYYNRAVKLIEQKKALEASIGNTAKKPVVPTAPEAEPAPAAAAPVEAAANGTPPKKPKKKKAATVKVSLHIQPETQFAEAPPVPGQVVDAEFPEVVPAAPAPDSKPAADPGPVIHLYGDAEALADGTLVDVSALKVEIKGTAVTRMTATIYARMSQAVKAVQVECLQAQAPFVSVVAERNWIVSQIKQAVIKGDILQVPRTPTSGAIWIMENEGGGFTMLAPSDY